jgi:hypothetical protein
MDIKATKTNTVVITTSDNLKLHILKLPNNNLKKGFRTENRDQVVPIPHPNLQARIRLSIPMGS